MTTVARSAFAPATSNTGPRCGSHEDADGAAEDPMGAGRSGTDESTGGTLRSRSQAASHTREARHTIATTDRTKPRRELSYSISI